MKADNVQISRLANGLEVVRINLPSFHSITSFLVVKSGSRQETLQNNGVSHFLEHLVFKGTRKYADTLAIARAIEGIGGYFNAWTANDHTAYWNVVPKDQYQRGIEIAFELAFHPRLPKEDMEREKGVIIEEIRRIYDDPAHLVDEVASGLIYQGHPLGLSVIGSIESIKKMTIEQFQEHHQRFYSLANSSFVIIGDVAKLEIDQQLEELTSGVAEGQRYAIEPFTGTSQQRLKVVNKQTDQTHLMLGMAEPGLGLNSDQTHVAAVLNAVLGQGMSSRLFLNIREKKGLAYAINSQLASFEETGAIIIYGGVNTSKINQTLESLEEEFAQLADHKVPAEELSKAKALVGGLLELSHDRPIDLAKWYGASRLLGSTESIEQAKSKIEQVNAEQVQQLAQQLLSKSRQSLAVVGPYPDQDIFAQFLAS